MRNESYRRIVQHVIDGDTFSFRRKIGKFNKVRLADVKAPPKNTVAGRKAMMTLRGMIGGRTVTIKPVGISYDRVVAEVYADRKNVNRRMIERGY